MRRNLYDPDLSTVLHADTDDPSGGVGGRDAAPRPAVAAVLVRLDGDQRGGRRGDGAGVSGAALLAREHELAAHACNIGHFVLTDIQLTLKTLNKLVIAGVVPGFCS